MPAYTDRVVGGDAALLGQFPWQVALVRDLEPSRQFCGGALITNSHVLSAAHCTTGLSPLNVGVAVGLTNLSASNNGDNQAGAVVAVREIVNHPDYRSDSVVPPGSVTALQLESFQRLENKLCRRHLHFDSSRSH